MLSKLSVIIATVAFVFAVGIPSVRGASDAKFFGFDDTTCSGGAQDEFQQFGCNTCISPSAGNFGSVSLSGFRSNQRIESHNQPGCTAKSLVGQFYGNACNERGSTAIRSIYVAC